MIPSEFFEHFFHAFPLEVWLQWFEKHSQYKSFFKGFRHIERMPQKRFQSCVVRLLRENSRFRQDALKLWEGKGREVWEYTAEHLRQNLAHYLDRWGKAELFWILLASPQEEHQSLAEELLKEELPTGGEPTQLSYTPQEVEHLRQISFEEGRKSLEEELTSLREELHQVTLAKKALADEVGDLRAKLQDLSRENRELRELVKKLEEDKAELLRQLDQLRRENRRLENEFPPTFTPCSLVEELKTHLKGLEERLALLARSEKEREREQEKQLDQRRQLAELQQKVRLLEEENERLRLERDHYSHQDVPTSVSEPQEPSQKSSKSLKEKIRLPSEEHHYPRRTRQFLEALARLPYVEQIWPVSFENTSRRRIKSKDSQGGFMLLYSDGQKGMKVFVQTTARTPAEMAFVEKKLEQLLEVG